MKTAIYIERGVAQVVLTPETDAEKMALELLKEKRLDVKRGSFYECQGGWVRHGYEHDDKSTILVVAEETTPVTE